MKNELLMDQCLSQTCSNKNCCGMRGFPLIHVGIFLH